LRIFSLEVCEGEYCKEED